MPYIKQEDRARAEHEPNTPGELNFAITTCAVEFLAGAMDAVEFYHISKSLCYDYLDEVGMSYTNANAVVGVLVCVVKELRRRVKNYEGVNTVAKKLESVSNLVYDDLLAPYEDTKIAENGDVYHEEMLAVS